MPIVTIVIAILLIILGPVAFFMSGTESWTPFIPSIFGIVLAVCGRIAMRKAWRMHAMHASVLIALLGAGAAGARSLPNVRQLFSTEGDAPRIGLAAQLIMTLLCTVYVVLAVRSFITARKNRKEG